MDMYKIRDWKLIPSEPFRLGKSLFPGVLVSLKTAILESRSIYSKRFEGMYADFQDEEKMSFVFIFLG